MFNWLFKKKEQKMEPSPDDQMAKKREEEVKEYLEKVEAWKKECAELEEKYCADMAAAILEIDGAEKYIPSVDERKRLLKAIRRWRIPYDGLYHSFPREPLKPYSSHYFSMLQEHRPSRDSEYRKIYEELRKKTIEADKKLSDAYGPVAKDFLLMSDEENSTKTFRETIFYQKRQNGTLQKHVTIVTKDGVETFGMNVVFVK